MAWYWMWVLVLGVVVTVGGVLAGRLAGGGRGSSPSPPWSSLLAGVALAALAFLLCLPARAPFAAGTQLGYGLLLGAAAALLASLVWRLARPTPEYASQVIATAASSGLALVWVALTQLLFRADPQYALLGGIIGALIAALPAQWARTNAGLTFFTCALALAGLSSLLGAARYTLASERPYWALPAIPLAAGLLGVIIGALLLGRLRWNKWATAAVVVIITAAACLWNRSLLLSREHITLAEHFRLLLLLGWLTAAALTAAAATSPNRCFATAAPVLLGVLALFIAFNLGAGFGASLLLAAALPLALALRSGPEEHEPLVWFLTLGLVYLAFRLYLSSYEDWFRSGLTVEFGRHYGLIGIAAGMLWLGTFRGIGRSSLALLALLASAALLPAVLFLALGAEALAGLLVGLWLAQLALPLLTARGWNCRAGSPNPAPAALLPLIATVAVALPPWGEFMLDQPRLIRGLVVAIAAVLAFLLLAYLRQQLPGEQSAQTAEG